MRLSDKTYDIIEEQYGTETAEYAEEMVNPRNQDSSFPDLDGRPEETGLGVNMEEYRETAAQEGLKPALEEFAEDLDETAQRGVLELLSAEAYDTEI
jgi:hypothetical protein